MKKRYLECSLQEICFPDHKMAFVSGPRQCGKTTMARMILKKRKSGHYYNWDDVKFRKMWVKDPSNTILYDGKICPIFIFDEIHKAKMWKRTLKGIYDTREKEMDIIVTGSARLNVYKKGSDSLLGRYYHFRLHPFSLAEISGHSISSPENLREKLFGGSRTKTFPDLLKDLFEYGPFPDPFLSSNVKKANLWRKNRLERVIREDLRDLTRTLELSQIEMLAALLPEKVGSPISLNSLREDLEVTFNTVKRWINWLKELYYLFEIKPYFTSIRRSLKKEGKIYLWDYSEISESSARFENLIAGSILKACHHWTDGGEGEFDLHYLRNKEKKEIDFLITKAKNPFLPIEVKWRDTEPSNNWNAFMKDLNCEYAVQVVFNSGIRKIYFRDNYRLLVISADDFLQYFV